MDQAAYLRRIHYSGRAVPELRTLKLLQRHHLLAVPFENLDIHYGIKIELDIDRIFGKVVHRMRGGFCYELNGLFYALLSSLGFDVRMISARTYHSENGYGPEYDHLAMIVSLNGDEYLTDVGFGEFAMTPLSRTTKEVQQDERGDFVFDQYDQEYIRVSKLEGGDRIPQYIFSPVERKYPEFAGMCHYHQTSPDSHFTKKKMISLATAGGRVTLTTDRLKIKEGNRAEEKLINGDGEFDEALWRYFEVII